MLDRGQLEHHATRNPVVGLPPHEREALPFAHLLDDRVTGGAVRLEVRGRATGSKVERQRAAEPRRELIGIGEQVPGLLTTGVQDDLTLHSHPASIVQLSGCTTPFKCATVWLHHPTLHRQIPLTAIQIRIRLSGILVPRRDLIEGDRPC